MSELIVFGDVEQWQIDYLTAVLPQHGYPGIPVSSQVSPINPSVRVLGTGGARQNIVVDNPSLVWEAWDATEAGASALARLMRALVEALPWQGAVGGVDVYRADCNTPQNLPDPESSRIRYTFTGSLLVRGYALQ